MRIFDLSLSLFPKESDIASKLLAMHSVFTIWIINSILKIYFLSHLKKTFLLVLKVLKFHLYSLWLKDPWALLLLFVSLEEGSITFNPKALNFWSWWESRSIFWISRFPAYFGKASFRVIWSKSCYISKMIDITLLILLILFPVFTILIGWRLMYYYLSDDFAKGFYAGKIVFVLQATVRLSV